MSESNEAITADSEFTILAVRKLNPAVLLQASVPFRRLMDEIVIPFETGEMFFVDGAPVKATDLDRLKIVMNRPFFKNAYAHLHWSMRTADAKTKEMYAKQYSTFLEALVRENCEDVTSQVVSAYRTAIKPKIKDYLPNRESLLDAGVKVFIETMKVMAHHP